MVVERLKWGKWEGERKLVCRSYYKKRHKTKPKQTNGDYSGSLSLIFQPFHLQEKSRILEWEKRKSSRLGSSMDSLLSVDDLPHESRVPSLPPKTNFVSTGNLLPPALPPKQRNMKKRVAISTDEVRIIGIGGYSSDDYNDAETFKSMSRQIHPSNYCPPPIDPPAPQPGECL